MNISIDEDKIQELLTRGVEHVYPKPDFLAARLKSGEQLTLYTGYDPTAPTLHIGHGITLLKLRQFQDLGHKVIMLIGDFTGMIGDPTDKLATRKQLTREEVIVNAKNYQKQASNILDFEGDNPVEVRYNSEWSDLMTLRDFFPLAAKLTVPQLLERDMFQERLREGGTIHLHEFLYPVMQGYDSVAMKVNGEVGGNDQTFNMLAGRDLMKELVRDDKGNPWEKFVLTVKLLADSSGKKMGKSEGNMVAFTDSAEDMFGKVMSWTDGIILSAFELCTRVPMTEIEAMKKNMESGANPRDFKLRLAYEITKTFLGEDMAKKGEANFHAVIQNKDKPSDIPELKPSTYDIITILVESKLCSSNSDARRAIEGAGVKVNDVKVESFEMQVATGDVVQKGKRFFVKVL